MANGNEGPRTAIVTGGARRIGAALCRALAADGWHLLIHCSASEREAAALAAELGNSKMVSADLADPGAAATIIAALDGLPPPRLLVNNAARFAYDAADDFTAAQWDEHQAVNVRAPALLSQAFAKAVGLATAGAEPAAGHGLIVNLLDAKLLQPNPDFFSYTVSKMALAGLTELLARAYGPRGMRVCGIAPAVTLRSGAQTAANFEAVHTLNPIGRGVMTEDIVEALRFIVRSPTLTGQIITLDGGQRFLGLARDVQFLEQQ
jgi:NAD(P)-dependent dehydrogenase (short-subunit alcohol dehydrogenase family)